MTNITQESLNVFLAYAKDAGNWSGQPFIGADGNVCASHEAARSERGNITQLKKAGLIRTHSDRGCTFMIFTDAGVALAADHGVDLSRF